jgi:hypothetical protein
VYSDVSLLTFRRDVSSLLSNHGVLHPVALGHVDDVSEEFAALILRVKIPLRPSIETPIPPKRRSDSRLPRDANSARQNQH